MSSHILSDYVLETASDFQHEVLKRVENFISADKEIYGKFDDIPRIWKCSWYNDPRKEGYKKGDFLWLNTEDVSKFLKDNAQEIRDIANSNPMVVNKLPEWRSNDQTVYDAYFNVLTGYMDDTKSCPLSAVFEIGELSACNQLIVSQIDGNKSPITDVSAWKKFMITDAEYDDIVERTYQMIDSAIKDHEYNYHFGDDVLTPEIENSLTNYVDVDFKNAKNMYPQNYIKAGDHTSGFDTVEIYVKKPLPNATVNGTTMENVWFRKWKSGYLEHGGTINISSYVDHETDKVVVPFSWKLSENDSSIYDVRFLGSKESAISAGTSDDPEKNLISILYEIDKDNFKVFDSLSAPIYDLTSYSVSLSPIYQTEGLVNGLQSNASYSNLGNYSYSHNVVNNNVILTDIKKDSFSFEYSKDNTPMFYSYYVAGFCKL